MQAARRTLAVSALCIPAGCLVTLLTCRLALGWHDAKASYSRNVHQQAIWLQGAAACAAVHNDMKWSCFATSGGIVVQTHSEGRQPFVGRCTGAAAMLELLSEPLYILAAVQLRFRLRALVDTAAIVVKSAMTVALLQLTALPPALALSWAQVAFAAVTLVCYGAAYAQELPSWLMDRDSNAAAVCRQQGLAGSYQQAGSSLASSAAAEAVLHGNIRQRNLVQQHDVPAEHTEINHAPAGVQKRLLHGPTLWLCGSFSLQVWAGPRATHTCAQWQLAGSKGVKQSVASFTGCRETGAGGGFQDGHGGPSEHLQPGNHCSEHVEHPRCRLMDGM